MSKTSLTRIRIPRTQGLPPHCRGFTVIRSNKFCIHAKSNRMNTELQAFPHLSK